MQVVKSELDERIGCYFITYHLSCGHTLIRRVFKANRKRAARSQSAWMMRAETVKCFACGEHL
jgi:hypothetical protein